MRVIGKPVGVDGWKQHYQAMSVGELSRKRMKHRRAPGKSHLYHLKSEQTGGGTNTAVKVISPIQAEIAQAKKIVENKQRAKTVKRKEVVRKKRSPPKPRKKTPKLKRKKKGGKTAS